MVRTYCNISINHKILSDEMTILIVIYRILETCMFYSLKTCISCMPSSLGCHVGCLLLTSSFAFPFCLMSNKFLKVSVALHSAVCRDCLCKTKEPAPPSAVAASSQRKHEFQAKLLFLLHLKNSVAWQLPGECFGLRASTAAKLFTNSELCSSSNRRDR